MTALTDSQWAVISSLLPKQNFERGGRPRADDKKTLEAILWVLRTGAQWSELPPKYGSSATAWRRLKAWEENGVWKKIWKNLLATLSKADKLQLNVGFVDGTFAPSKKGGLVLVRRRKAREPK